MVICEKCNAKKKRALVVHAGSVLFKFMAGDVFSCKKICNWMLKVDKIESEFIFFHSFYAETQEIITEYMMCIKEFTRNCAHAEPGVFDGASFAYVEECWEE